MKHKLTKFIHIYTVILVFFMSINGLFANCVEGDQDSCVISDDLAGGVNMNVDGNNWNAKVYVNGNSQTNNEIDINSGSSVNFQSGSNHNDTLIVTTGTNLGLGGEVNFEDGNNTLEMEDNASLTMEDGGALNFGTGQDDTSNINIGSNATFNGGGSDLTLSSGTNNITMDYGSKILSTNLYLSGSISNTLDLGQNVNHDIEDPTSQIGLVAFTSGEDNTLTMETNSVLNVVSFESDGNNTINISSGSKIANDVLFYGSGTYTINIINDGIYDPISIKEINAEGVTSEGTVNLNVNYDLTIENILMGDETDNIKIGTSANVSGLKDSINFGGGNDTLTMGSGAAINFDSGPASVNFGDSSVTSGQYSVTINLNSGSAVYGDINIINSNSVINIGDQVVVDNIVAHDNSNIVNISGYNISIETLDFSDANSVTFNIGGSDLENTEIKGSFSGDTQINVDLEDSETAHIGTLTLGGENNTIEVSGNFATLLIDNNLDFNGTQSNTLIVDNNTVNVQGDSITFLGSASNTIYINSDSQIATIKVAEDGAEEGDYGEIIGYGDNDTIIMNQGFMQSLQPVYIYATLENIENIDLGLTHATIDSIDENNDTNLYIDVVQLDYDDGSSAIVNGEMLINGDANFNGNKLYVNIRGINNSMLGATPSGKSELTTPYTMIIADVGGEGVLRGLTEDDIIVTGDILETDVSIDENDISVTINACNTVTGLLEEGSENGGCTIDTYDGGDDNDTFTSNDPNVISIAHALDNVMFADSDIEDSNENFQPIIDDVMSTDRDNIEKYLRQLEPVNNEVLLNLARENSEIFIEKILNEQSFFSEGAIKTFTYVDYDNFNLKDANYIQGTDQNGISAGFAMEKDLVKSSWGIALGYTNSTIDSNETAYDGNSYTIDVGLYNKYRLGKKAYIKTMVSYSDNNYNLNRYITHTDNSVSAVKSSPKVDNISINSMLGYKLPTSSFISQVYGKVAYDYFIINSYQESGVGALNVDGSNNNEIEGNLGVNIEKLFEVNKGYLVPNLSLEMGYNYYQKQNTEADFVDAYNVDDSFTNYAPGYSGVYGKVNIGLSYMLSSKVSMGINGRFEAAKNYFDKAGYVSFNYTL